MTLQAVLARIGTLAQPETLLFEEVFRLSHEGASEKPMGFARKRGRLVKSQTAIHLPPSGTCALSVALCLR